jgi:hypothetical protein
VGVAIKNSLQLYFSEKKEKKKGKKDFKNLLCLGLKRETIS